MSDPIPSILTRLANTQRTLPNGGGNYAVANSTPATGDMNSQLTPSSYIKPSTVLSGPTTMSAAPTPWYMPSNDRGPASYGASQLANLPTQPATPEQIAAFNAGGPQTNNSQQSGQGGGVNQGWGGSPTVNEGGTGGGTPSGSTPGSVNPPEGFDPLRAYRDLAMEQAMHSSQGTGLYGLKKGVQYSPDQILEQRKSADNIYNQALQEYSTYANNEGRKGGMTSVDENGNIIQGNQSSFDPLTIGRYNRAVNSATSILQKNPTFKNIIGSSAYLDRIEAAIKNPGSVGDQELLDSFTQLNTGGNRVTEAQVHLITGSGSFSDLINQFTNKMKTGGALSQDQRNEIVKLSKEVYGNYQKSYKPLYDDAVGRLKAQGIPKQFWNIPSPDTLSRAVSESEGSTSNNSNTNTGASTSGFGWNGQ